MDRLARIRQRLAVRRVRFNGEMVATDANVQTLLGILRTIPGLKTTGSCGGHAERNEKWPDCSQPLGHWFVSFRAPRPMLNLLHAFAKTVGVRFDRGPKNTLPVCGVCVNKGERVWYGMWGKGDPRRIAAKLQRFLMTRPLRIASKL